MEVHELDELDRKIITSMVNNVRKPFLEVSRECNVSGASIHQRMHKLIEAGVVKGTELILDNTKIGYDTCAYIGLYLKNPGQYSEVVNALAEIPEVVECHYTTGRYDLFIKLYAKNNRHLLDLIHHRLQPLLARTETLISFKEEFKRHMPLIADRANDKADKATKATKATKADKVNDKQESPPEQVALPDKE